MEYDLIVDPYAPAALLIFIVACVLPCTNIPQPEITVLELTGVIVTLPIDGITLDGAVIVNPFVPASASYRPPRRGRFQWQDRLPDTSSRIASCLSSSSMFCRRQSVWRRSCCTSNCCSDPLRRSCRCKSPSVQSFWMLRHIRFRSQQTAWSW